MKNTTQNIERFLESKKNAWSLTTLNAYKGFLNKYGELVNKSNPSAFLESLRMDGIKPYSIQTYFIQAANYWEFLNPTKTNPYKTFRKDNRNVFKNAYESKRVTKSYEEIKEIINSLPDCEEKTAILYILKTAQRASEAGLRRKKEEAGIEAQDYILGKGGKRRINLGVSTERGSATNYYRVRRFLLRHTGLNLHELRKLALTRAADLGAGPADLCAIAGWSSINTAIRYLQPKDAERLKKYLE